MDPAIRLIVDKAQLEGTAYFELLPGKFGGTHWNEGSVFLDEEVFCLIEKPFAECVPEYDHYTFMDVPVEHWNKVLQSLMVLRTHVSHARNVDDIQDFLFFSWRDTKGRFAEEFEQNRQDLIALIDDVVRWVSECLKKEDTIAVLGM